MEQKRKLTSVLLKRNPSNNQVTVKTIQNDAYLLSYLRSERVASHRGWMTSLIPL
jgi:hypothetical protein